MFMLSFVAVPEFVGDFGSAEFPQCSSEGSSLITFVGEVDGPEAELQAGFVENPDLFGFGVLVGFD